MIATDRLIRPTFNLQAYFPQFAWNTAYDIKVSADGIVMVDPIYLADVYNDDSRIATLVRTLGTFVYDFGGDVSGPIWLKDPFLVMPISMHYGKTRPEVPPEATVLCDHVGCDSGSFVLLPLSKDIPAELGQVIDKCLRDGDAVLLSLMPGNWHLMFEQFDPPQANMVALYRNIVLQRT